MTTTTFGTCFTGVSRSSRSPAFSLDLCSIVFTQLDKTNPQRRFFFTLKVDENEMYLMDDCQPHVTPMKQQELLDALNDAGDDPDSLSSFVRGMRKAFLDTLA